MDTSGTSSLPDSQLDRFMVSYSLSELNDDDKIEMLKKEISFVDDNPEKIDWKKIKEKKNKVTVKDEIYKYVINIEQTIQSIDRKIYISARCLKQIIDLARGWALINEKDYVTHQDIKDTIPYILRHRIRFLNQEEKIEFVKKEILEKIDIN